MYSTEFQRIRLLSLPLKRLSETTEVLAGCQVTAVSMLMQLERRRIHYSAHAGMEMRPIQLSEATCSRYQC